MAINLLFYTWALASQETLSAGGCFPAVMRILLQVVKKLTAKEAPQFEMSKFKEGMEEE